MPLQKPSGRALRIAMAAVGVTALAVLAQRAGWLDSGPPDRPGRAWVWTADDPRDVRPRTFFLARDFELERIPDTAVAQVLGDPEYLLWINGERAGSGRYHAHAPLDVFDVAQLLRVGSNRVVLELRSAVGSGAATLAILDGAGVPLVETGSGWRILPATWRDVLDAPDPLPRAAEAAVLGRSPFGRWGNAGPGPRRPLFRDVVLPESLQRAGRYRLPLESGRFAPLPPRDTGRPSLGPLVEFDFGRPVAGYLVLRLRDSEKQVSAGLLRFGFSPSDGSGWQPDVVAVAAGGRAQWHDVEPRRFRYVEVAGLDGLQSAAVVPVDPKQFGALLPFGSEEGLLGIVPPTARLPVEVEIWKRLQERERVELEPGEAPAAGLRRGGGARIRRRTRGRDEPRSPQSARAPSRPAEPEREPAPTPPPASPPAGPGPESPPPTRG